MTHLSTQRRMYGKKINPFWFVILMIAAYTFLIAGFYFAGKVERIGSEKVESVKG